MCKVLVFAGTTEGRKISEFLEKQKIQTHVCVATEYGETLLPKSSYLSVSHERLDETAMKEAMQNMHPSLVIDSTHPYAAEVTKNIRKACEETKTEYVRLLRAGSTEDTKNDSSVYVDSVDEAVEYLSTTTGNVLVTTGSKEIHKYTKIENYKERIFARVLSLSNVAEHCKSLGFEGRNLICMQGPFSMELNEAMLRQFDCRYLVTKMSGVTGGYEEKLEAAKRAGCICVIVGRPLKEEGLGLIECKALLCQRFGLKQNQKVSLVGIGMGNPDTCTIEAIKAIKEAELLIGAKRMVESVLHSEQDVLIEYNSEKIKVYLDKHPEYEKIAVLLSGDVGFYSGAKKLQETLKERKVRQISGLSSPIYFMAKIGRSWDDAVITSAHGKEENLVELIKTHQKVVSILGTKDAVANLAKTLTNYGMGKVTFFVGERLSYPDEAIVQGSADSFCDYEGDALSVIYIENKEAEGLPSTHGVKDSAFLRDKVPMTKEEVRCVSLAKLGLREDSVCYDVGAGTGSVSVEMALRTPKGRVYAIEKKETAVELLKKNKQKFVTDNLSVIEGVAPEALEALEVPTHAFIGGSSGNMESILRLLLEKNPKIRVVINCIALESVAEANCCMKVLPFEDVEMIQLSVSRAKKIGSYQMMMGENPITIFSATGKKEEKEEE